MTRANIAPIKKKNGLATIALNNNNNKQQQQQQ